MIIRLIGNCWDRNSHHQRWSIDNNYQRARRHRNFGKKKEKKRKEKIVVKLEFNLTGTEIEMESLFISGFKGILEDKNGRWLD